MYPSSGSADRLRRLREPARGIGVDERRQRVANPDVIRIEPSDLVIVEERGFDQVAVDRGEGEGLETEHLALGRAVRWLHQNEIFDADAVGAGLVVAGLV